MGADMSNPMAIFCLMFFGAVLVVGGSMLLAAYLDWLSRKSVPGKITGINANTLTELRERADRATAEAEACRAGKHLAYYERNLVIVLLARILIEEGLVTGTRQGFNLGTGTDEHFRDWKTCLYIDTPYAGVGQLNWHFHDQHAWMVDTLAAPSYAPGKWDGRTKEEKFVSIEAWLRKLGDADAESLRVEHVTEQDIKG